jgi:hypothetical protein
MVLKRILGAGAAGLVMALGLAERRRMFAVAAANGARTGQTGLLRVEQR